MKIKAVALILLFTLIGANSWAIIDVDWKGISPSDAVKGTDKQKTVYLYNVGKKMFLGQGGNWGVEAMLSDVGLPYQISLNSEYNCYYLKQKSENQYLCPVSIESSDTYKLYFLTGHSTAYGFNFTETSEGSGKYRISYDNGNYYMVAKSVSGTTAGAAENLRICIMSSSDLSSVDDNSDQWILVTQEASEQKLVSTAIESKTLFDNPYAPCTFLVKDYDFGRNHVDVGSWVGLSSDGTKTALTNSTSAMSVPTSESKPSITYYVGNGYDVNASEQSSNGGKWTANIFGNGTIQQTISDIATIGWYKVTAGVATNATTCQNVKLFAQVGDETISTGKASTPATQSALSGATSFVSAEELTNETTNQLSVEVFVGKDDEGNIKPLTFGVQVAGAEDYAWTCMDNFTLTYLGALRNKVVLDEDKTDISYMNTQNDEVAKSGQSTMFLHRTLKANQWNSIVLPFSISSDIFKRVFGEDAKISKLVGANDSDKPNQINFTDCTSEGIQAGCLYVIYPTQVAFNSTGGDITSSADDDITLSKGTYYALDGTYGQDSDFSANITGDSGAEVYNTQGKVTFMGTYVSKVNVIPVHSYYISDGQWKYNTQKTSHAKGFRGWLQTSSESGAKQSFIIAINGVADMDETTGIDMPVADDVINGVNIYDLTGNLVRANASSTDGLKRGVYIAGGKKIVVK